jgi:hypothetical protein
MRKPIFSAVQARAYLEGSLPNSGLRLPCFVCGAISGQPCDPDCPDLDQLHTDMLAQEVEDDLYLELMADARAGR